MKQHHSIVLLLSLIFGSLSVFGQTEESKNQISIRYCTQQEAQDVLNVNDPFAENLTLIDCQIRLRKSDATKEGLLKALPTDAEEWSEDEIQKIEACVLGLEERLNKLDIHLSLPEQIDFVKSNMKSDVEAAGFTRGNTVVLFPKVGQLSNSDLEALVLHELFHVLTRNNPELRKQLYSVINFTVLDDEIEIPTDIKSKMISNPDVERHDSYATFEINGNMQKGLVLLYANRDYKKNNGSALSYFSVGIMPLDDEFKAIQKKGKTLLFDLSEADNLDDIIGANTGYMIDPEEILADNFVFLVLGKTDLPNPEICERMKIILVNCQK